MSKKQPSTTKQVTEVKLPKWVEEASQGNYKLAEQLASRPYVGYEGPQVADQSQLTKDSYGLLKANIGAQDPLYENAADLYGRVTQLDPYYQRAQDLYDESAGPFDVTPYMNPYIENVENRAISNAERAITGQLAQNTDKARAAGAFGGSRGAVVDAVTRAEGARGIGDLSAQLRKEGFDTAASNFWKGAANKQAAASGIISGANTQGQGWRDAASGFLNTAQGRQQSVLADVAALSGAGKEDQAYRQSLIDADKAKFEEMKGHDVEQLNLRLAALGMSPYGKTESTTKTATQGSAGSDWATTLLGGFKLLAGLSDRRDKTDIKSLGRRSRAGLPLYAYRYKGDPKSYPKIIGPMAQDVEKAYPELVSEVGGHKIVHGLGILSDA